MGCETIMSTWTASKAKTQFNQLLQASLTEGPQVITVYGKEKAVLVCIREWQALQNQAPPGLKALLLAAPR
jgi:hypothetical protein